MVHPQSYGERQRHERSWIVYERGALDQRKLAPIDNQCVTIRFIQTAWKKRKDGDILQERHRYDTKNCLRTCSLSNTYELLTKTLTMCRPIEMLYSQHLEYDAFASSPQYYRSCSMRTKNLNKQCSEVAIELHNTPMSETKLNEKCQEHNLVGPYSASHL